MNIVIIGTSSTFAPNQWMFNHIVTKESIDRLENEGGVCILYTHLGYYHKNGKVDEGFKKMISYIGKKRIRFIYTGFRSFRFAQ